MGGRVRYERDLIDLADAGVTKGRSISETTAKKLLQKALDGSGITPTEERTLKYIVDNYQINEAARTLLLERVKQDESARSVSRSSQRDSQQTVLTQYEGTKFGATYFLIVALAVAICSLGVMAMTRTP